jgi:2,3-bisphosphoglycerate-independent phosphoglycerate mutase
MLIVRDGWGSNPHPEWNHANAVHLAKTPVDDRLMATYPHGLIRTSGEDVGLPDGVMGNSEVGHQNIGAGRIVEQEVMRITGRIRDGSFFANEALVGAFDHAVKTGGSVHLMGLCSDGRVHSDLEHLYALLDLSQRRKFPGNRVFVHAFMDGRDTAPNRGLHYIAQIEQHCRQTGVNPIATVCGRYYAMDRDNRWDRVQRAYDVLTGREKEVPCFGSAAEAVDYYYDHPSGDSMHGDEFVAPAATLDRDPTAGRIRSGDAVIFFNFRGDRPRELVRAFTFDQFPYDGVGRDGKPAKLGFDRGERLSSLYFATMTAYEQGLPVKVAYIKPPKMVRILGAYLSELGLTQFRSAETEKYPHVTFFFNDYRDEPFAGEQHMLVDSPRDVATYDEKPEMSARGVTDGVLAAIASGKFDVYIVNFANGDMVGHTGSLPAAITAVEVVDECVGKLTNAVLARGGALLITADHGNCEQMTDPSTGGPHTAHTTYPVELIVVDDDAKGLPLRSGGRLADIAPTMLALLGITKPTEMTGTSLVAIEAAVERARG